MVKSVSDGFQFFLSRIQLLSLEQAKARRHRDSIRNCIANNFGCYDIIETGSFGNNTGVRHYSDTDYFALIPAESLSTNSAIALRNLKQAFQHSFPKTREIEVNSPAVRIPFGKFASEIVDVTPCYFTGRYRTPLGYYPRYLIPDGDREWMPASPGAHNKYVKTVDEQLRGKLKPVIKLIKAWKFMTGAPIISFYLELRITRLLGNTIIFSYDQAIFNILYELHRVQLADMRDPMGISGLIPSSNTSCQKNTALSKLSTALSRAEKAYAARLKGDHATAFYYWNLLFGNEFPTR
jgi:hypothetical protein